LGCKQFVEKNKKKSGIRRTGQLKNETIGDLFGPSYSGASPAVKSAKLKLPESRQLQTKFDQLHSLFKL